MTAQDLINAATSDPAQVAAGAAGAFTTQVIPLASSVTVPPAPPAPAPAPTS